MNQLKYIFDKKQIENKGISNAESYVKNAFKSMFTKQLLPVNGVVNSNLFDVIWSNAPLRESLFGVIPPTLLNAQKPLKIQDFANWVLTLDNRIFNFVNVQ
jgi:hypothetical protein